jgi:hypothetical protein
MQHETTYIVDSTSSIPHLLSSQRPKVEAWSTNRALRSGKLFT